MRVFLQPSRCEGHVQVPPSKSMAHRALLCAALAKGESVLENVVPSQDIQATARAVRALGAQVTPGEGRVCVAGAGGVGRRRVAGPVDCGESGSTLRFVIPLFSLTGAPVRFCGHGRLMERPQNIYEALFRERGLRFEHGADGIVIEGALGPGEYEVDGSVSSQFLSGLLFALPLLDADSVIRVTPPFESRSYVGLTLQMLADFGVQIAWEDALTLRVPGRQAYRSRTYTVEGDDSQAAFFAVLGAVCGGVRVEGLRADSRQGDRVIFDILRRCGASMRRVPGGWVFQKAPLCAARIDLSDCPDLGPILMVLGLFCEGETVIENAGRLRVKESDRIAAMEQEITKLGGAIASNGGTVTVRGAAPGALHAATLCSHNDHRIAMAMSVAALCAGVPVSIEGAEAVNKSYPGFFDVLKSLGTEVKTDETA